MSDLETALANEILYHFKMDELEKTLATTIKNMDMEFAHTLIVDNDVQPKEICDNDMWLFMCEAARLKDKPLLRRLCKVNSYLSGKLLWIVLDDLEVATALVKAGADLNVLRDDSTRTSFLHVLLASNDPSKLQLVEMMVNRGADVSAVDSHGNPVVLCAVRAGVSQDFLQKFSLDQTVDFKRTALAIAESGRWEKLMPLLIYLITEDRADQQTRSRRARDAIHTLHVWPGQATDNKWFIYVRRSCKMMIEILLLYLMPADMVPFENHLPTMLKGGHFADIAVLFYKRGANPNVEVSMPPLHHASNIRDLSLVNVLLKHEADVHRRDFLGRTPIYGACKNSLMSNILLFIRLGAEVNIIDLVGKTPLSFLFEKRHESALVIRQLALAAFRGSDINTRDVTLIQSNSATQELFDSSLKELERMKRTEADGDIPYYSFLTGSVDKMSRFTRRDDITDIFDDHAKLRQLFPNFYCDLQNAYVFAKKREGLLIEKEQLIYETVAETFQISLPYFVVNKIVNYLNLYPLKHFVLDFHSNTFHNMIFE